MKMTDWAWKLDDFLKFNERNILQHAGKVSHQLVQEHAEREFETYEADRRRIEASQPSSDFDRVVEEVKQREDQHKASKKLPKKPEPNGPDGGGG